MSKVRYKVDPYRDAIIDQDRGMMVCERAAAAQYFAQKKSKMRDIVCELDGRIAELTQQKYQLQAKCRHIHAVAEHKSDTGNWCEADDRYWINFRCYDCGHVWSEDQ